MRIRGQETDGHLELPRETLSKKKVLFITHLYYPSIGGAERVFQRIAEGLATRGYSVTVLTSDALSTEQYFTWTDNKLPGHENVNGVQVIREPLDSTLYKILKILNIFNKLGRASIYYRPLIFGPHFFAKFKEVLREEYDAIIAGPTPTSTIYYGILCKKKHPSSKLIIFPHMHIADRLHTSPINRWAIKAADAVFTLTEAESKYLVRKGIKEQRIKRIVNGVDDFLLEEKPQMDDELNDYVLYLGQEGGHKRIPLLIRAMKNIWKRGYENKLVIAGARTYFSPTLDKLIAELPQPYRSKIHRFNDIPEEQKVKLLDNCRVMVNPSTYEAFGLVFLEAWARKKPVIGARIEAIQEIIKDGQNGFLFESKSIRDLQRKLLRILDDRSLAANLGETGYKAVKEKYTWNKIIDQIDVFLP